MTPLPFVRRAYVEKLQFFPCALYFVHGHLSDLIEWQSGVVPRFHSADEIAGELVITSA